MRKWHDNFISLKCPRVSFVLLSLEKITGDASGHKTTVSVLGLLSQCLVSMFKIPHKPQSHLQNWPKSDRGVPFALCKFHTFCTTCKTSMLAPQNASETSFVDSICNVLCGASLFVRTWWRYKWPQNKQKHMNKNRRKFWRGTDVLGKKTKRTPTQWCFLHIGHCQRKDSFLARKAGQLYFHLWCIGGSFDTTRVWVQKQLYSVFVFNWLFGQNIILCMCAIVKMRFLCTFKLTQACTGLLACF